MPANAALRNAMLRAAIAAVSSGGSRSRLLVLMYHRVLRNPDPMLPDEPDVGTFSAQMDLVADLLRIMPLSEAARGLVSGRLPPRAACITFDDGYANNLDVAAPVLHARGLPATVFVASGYLGNGLMWNDAVIEAVRAAPAEPDLTELGLGRLQLTDAASRRIAATSIIDGLKYAPPADRLARASEIATYCGAELPANLMLSEDGVRQLGRYGIEVGAHTVTHPILARVPDAVARREIADSKHHLESITGERITAFAYPNGRPGQDFEARHVRMVGDAGFDLAVTTAWGSARPGIDLLQIPRIAPWDRTPLRYAARLVKSCMEPPARFV